MYSEIFFYRNELVLYENAKNCFTRKMNKINLCCSIEKVSFYETVANIIRKTVF